MERGIESGVEPDVPKGWKTVETEPGELTEEEIQEAMDKVPRAAFMTPEQQREEAIRIATKEKLEAQQKVSSEETE